MSERDSYYLYASRPASLGEREMTIEHMRPRLTEAEAISRRLRASQELYAIFQAALKPGPDQGGGA